MTNGKRKPKKREPSEIESLAASEKDLTPIEQANIKKLQRWKKGNNQNDLMGDDSVESEESYEELNLRAMESTGLVQLSNGYLLLIQMGNALLEKGESLDELKTLVNANGSLMRELEPKNAIEGLLCAQILVCQQKAFDLLGKASAQSNIEWAKLHSNSANKLLVRAQSSLEALIRYRSKGQEMRVEHIHVGDGGRAAFGTFNTGGNENQNKNSGGTP